MFGKWKKRCQELDKAKLEIIQQYNELRSKYNVLSKQSLADSRQIDDLINTNKCLAKSLDEANKELLDIKERRSLVNHVIQTHTTKSLVYKNRIVENMNDEFYGIENLGESIKLSLANISEKIYEDCAYTVTSSVEPFGKVTEVTVIVCKPLD